MERKEDPWGAGEGKRSEEKENFLKKEQKLCLSWKKMGHNRE